VTGYGGQADFATIQNAYLVPYSFAPSKSHLQSDGSFWIEPDKKSLGHLLGMVYADVMEQDQRLQQKRLAGAQWMREHTSWRNTAQAIDQAAKTLLSESSLPPRKPLRLALLSPWNTTCGIAEHAHALLNNWPDDTLLRVFCDMRTAADPAQYVYTPCWSLSNCDSVVDALKEIAANDFQVLVVQHQQSLFLLSDSVCAALAEVRARGCVVVLELHSTLPLVRERRISQAAIRNLQMLDRVFVHKLDDVNYLLGLGLVDNVMCLPLGVTIAKAQAEKEVSRSSLGIEPNDLVLGCFGFLLPHKGLDVVIGSLRKLAEATGQKVKLLAVTAVLDERSQQTLNDCKNLAVSHGVADQIIWVTEFLPIQACLRLLVSVDMMVYAYGPTRESASAAVTVGLATGAAVLVSNQPIFSDVKNCTYTMLSPGFQGLVDAVCRLHQHPQEMRDLALRQSDWLAHRDWSHIGRQFRDTVHGLLADLKTVPMACNLPLPMQRQLLVDVSELYHRNAKTGIQRVVLNILQIWLFSPPPGFVVRPIYAVDAHGYKYTDKFFQEHPHLRSQLDEQPIQAGWGDIFLGLDLSAHLFPDVEPVLHQMRLRGVRVCYVIYDIIPLLRPDFSVGGMNLVFSNWLHCLRRQSDRLVCISNSVAQDVKLWLGGHTMEGAFPDVCSFHLGADLTRSQVRPRENVVEPLLERLASTQSFLMVGTVEPRKGQRQALKAFELLWQSGFHAMLIIVGKQGWMMDDFCLQLRQHPQAGHLLHWFEDTTDELLEGFYDSCSCLLAASEMEGFGLPLIEAARHQMPILARDISVFREVAEDHAFYFQGLHPTDLSEAVLEWSALDKKGLAPASRSLHWLTWQESADKLLYAIL